MNSTVDEGTPLGVGLTYWPALEGVIHDHADLIDVLEVAPETLWGRDTNGRYVCDRPSLDRVGTLPQAKVVHGVGDPVGGSARAEPAHRTLFAEVVDSLDAGLVTEHLNFSRADSHGSCHFAGFMLPPRQTTAGVDVAVTAIRSLTAGLSVPFGVENGVSYLRPRADELSDGEFMAAVVELADVGILLDLHNAYANERNGRQSMRAFLARLPLDRVLEVHLAGGREFDGYWLDAHCGAVPEPVIGLARELIGDLPNLRVLNFELMPEYLRDFGPSSVARQLSLCQELWANRRNCDPAPPHGGRPPTVAAPPPAGPSSAPAGPSPAPAGPSPGQWEAQLAALVNSAWDSAGVAGRWQAAADGTRTHPVGSFDAGLAHDPGVGILRFLVDEFRAGMVSRSLRLSIRLLIMHLGEDGVRRLLAGFWANALPQAFAADEADGFASYLATVDLGVPYLQEVVAFELAVLRAFTDGISTDVEFSADPERVLGNLARGVLPPPPTGASVRVTVAADSNG